MPTDNDQTKSDRPGQADRSEEERPYYERIEELEKLAGLSRLDINIKETTRE